MWVWNNGPWCFDNHLRALRRWEKGMSVRSVTFLKQPFWIQVWGLPFVIINEEAGSDIGRSKGELVEVDCKAFKSYQSRFLQIRVEVPLDKPPLRGGPVISSEGETTRVAFKYERPVGWCFNYGLIGHELKECQSLVNTEDGSRPYGEWLRAGTKGRQANPIDRNQRTKAPNTTATTPPEPDMHREPETGFLSKQGNGSVTPEVTLTHSHPIMAQSRPMNSHTTPTTSSQLASINETVSHLQNLNLNPIKSISHNAATTQPRLDNSKQSTLDQQQLKHPVNDTENHATNPFPVPITYGTNQHKPQTLDTPPSHAPLRDQLKKPNTKPMRKKITPIPAETHTEFPQSSIVKAGTKRQHDSNHGSDEAKRCKFEESTLQTELPTVEVEAQPCRSQ